VTFKGFCAHGVVACLRAFLLKRNEASRCPGRTKNVDGEMFWGLRSILSRLRANLCLMESGSSDPCGDGIDDAALRRGLFSLGDFWTAAGLGNHEPGIEAGLWREKGRKRLVSGVGNCSMRRSEMSAECGMANRYLIGRIARGCLVETSRPTDVCRISPWPCRGQKRGGVSGTVEFNRVMARAWEKGESRTAP